MLNFYKLVLISLIVFPAAAQVSTPTILISPSVACTGAPVQFSVQSTGTVLSQQWSVFPSKSVEMSNGNSPLMTAVFPKDLTYTVTILVTTTTGTAQASRPVNVFRSAVSAFNASVNSAGFPTELVLTNYSSYSSRNYWKFSGELAPDSTENLVKQYNASGDYSVTLIAFGTRGCNDTSSYSFNIASASSLVLPNVFTPNRDGINDVFKPITTGISELHAYVLNREGVMLHSWHKVNGFWDGRSTSGEACVDGQYFVILDAKGFDGKEYKMNGHITLIR